MIAALLIALVAAFVPASQAYIPAGTTAYAQLANFTSQWVVSLAKRDASATQTWTPHTCNATVLGAACNQPPLQQDSNMQVRISWQLRNASLPFKTLGGATPIQIVVRLDYGLGVATDRGWRKKNGAWPKYGKHAKWGVTKVPFSLAAGSAVWDLNEVDEVTDAILYPEVCVMCKFADGHIDFCQCSRRNGATNYLSIETQVMDHDITTGMRAATIIMSIASPTLLIIYAIADYFHYRRTGKALAFY